MAQVYIGINRGAGTFLNPDALTVGSSTGSTDMELRVDDSKSLTRDDVLQFLELVENYFVNKGESQIGNL